MTFFMLHSGERVKKKFIEVVPNRYFESTLLLMSELDCQLGKYLRSRLIETLTLSVMTIIALLILRVRFAIPIGIFAGLVNLIPYLGPFLGGAPAVIFALIDAPFGVWSVPLVIGTLFLLQFIDNMIVLPILVGRNVDLGPVTTIIAVLIGGKLLGLIGLLIAVPIAAISKVIVQVIYSGIKGRIVVAQ